MMHEILQVVSIVGRLVPVTKGVIDRWQDDNSVLEVLRGRENVFRALKGCDEATGVLFISRVLNGRDLNSAQKSLFRLERKDKVHRVATGWRFGPIPQRVEIVLKFAH